MKKNLAVGALLCGLTGSALADLTVLVVMEPTARKDGLILSRSALESGLGKQTGQSVSVTVTDDLAEAMRSTRSGGYDVFVAPAQVAASAMGHGYDLIGSTDTEEQFVLVGQPNLASVADMRQGRIYLPQQDSIYSYLARGLLNAGGLSFKDLKKVEYARYPQAGLTAVGLRLSDATVIRRDEWDLWVKDNGSTAKVLATSGAVPGGFSVTVKKELSADMHNQMSKWFAVSAPSCGMKPVIQHMDPASYRKVAELGTFTPTSLPGATLVTADEVKRLMSQGVILVDTRSEKEFKQKHIPGAIFAPYHEKSLKDIAFDNTQDDFSAIKTLNSKAPTIFQCNGAECWKSYKASRAAIAAGFAKVYWFRGGMPEWEGSGQQVAKE